MARVVYLIEPDSGVAAALDSFLRSNGYEARVYGSAEDFLATEPDPDGAVITEVELPGRSGIDLIETLAGSPAARPLIALAHRANVATAVRAMQAGASNVLEKPFAMNLLLDQIR